MVPERRKFRNQLVVPAVPTTAAESDNENDEDVVLERDTDDDEEDTHAKAYVDPKTRHWYNRDRLHKGLRKQILAGEYDDGTQAPTSIVIAEHYAVT